MGLQVHFRAAKLARERAAAPDPRCALPLPDRSRWTGELSLRHERHDATVAHWSETRTLDTTADAVALRLAATYQTEAGGKGEQAAEWRVTPDGTFLATPGAVGDLWMRRETARDERERVVAFGPGMLQVLVAAVDGWQPSDDGWQLGEAPLRCGPDSGRLGFVDRLIASTTTLSASLKRGESDDFERTLTAVWQLPDRSTLHAHYRDRVIRFDGEIATPEDVLPTARDRSFARAEELLQQLATDQLLTLPQPVENP